jgi:hypothetical protein
LLRTLADKGYCNAYAGIALPNAASVALHRSAGFHPIGVFPSVGRKFETWHDVAWFHQNLRAEPPLGPTLARPDPKRLEAPTHGIQAVIYLAHMRASTLVFLHRVIRLKQSPVTAYDAVTQVWSPRGPWRRLIAEQLAKNHIPFEPY